VVDHTTIDRINVLQAALRAMRDAAVSLPSGSFHFLLVDGNKIPEELPCPAEAVIKGDATCSCVAAASIIAKVNTPYQSTAFTVLKPKKKALANLQRSIHGVSGYGMYEGLRHVPSSSGIDQA